MPISQNLPILAWTDHSTLGEPSGAGHKPIHAPGFGEMALSHKDRDAFLTLQSGHPGDAMDVPTLPRTTRIGFTDLVFGQAGCEACNAAFSRALDQSTFQHRQETSTCTIS